ALREAIAQLTSAQVPSATTTAEVLLLHVLKRDRTFLYAHPEAELTYEQELDYRALLAERAAGKPTQYLTGRQEFWGLSFQVEPGVFIPRPETEHVVELALAIVRHGMGRADARICDVGTGSGCIALALAKELPEAEIVAVDLSERALAVARRNAEALNLANRVQFLKSDLLQAFFSHHGTAATDFDVRAFDLIVSNPPYVGRQEAERLPREVREHEPATALFSEDEGLALTHRLIDQAAQLLTGRSSPSSPAALWGPGFNPAVKGTERSGASAPEGGPSGGGHWAEHQDASVVKRSSAGPGFNPAVRKQEEPRALAPEVTPVAGRRSLVAGWLIIELGYEMVGRVRALLGEAWTNVEVTSDLRGLPRVLAAQRK
ncbi:MAG: peptide chain release factor N(5)-glutamine methyltransferase, partial [Terriglobia bacterium]